MFSGFGDFSSSFSQIASVLTLDSLQEGKTGEDVKVDAALIDDQLKTEESTLTPTDSTNSTFKSLRITSSPIIEKSPVKPNDKVNDDMISTLLVTPVSKPASNSNKKFVSSGRYSAIFDNSPKGAPPGTTNASPIPKSSTEINQSEDSFDASTVENQPQISDDVSLIDIKPENSPAVVEISYVDAADVNASWQEDFRDLYYEGSPQKDEISSPSDTKKGKERTSEDTESSKREDDRVAAEREHWQKVLDNNDARWQTKLQNVLGEQSRILELKQKEITNEWKQKLDSLEHENLQWKNSLETKLRSQEDEIKTWRENEQQWLEKESFLQKEVSSRDAIIAQLNVEKKSLEVKYKKEMESQLESFKAQEDSNAKIISEKDQKLQAVGEKMKELMKMYTDTKAKLKQQAEENTEEKLRTIQEYSNQKESELAALSLKLESMEQNLSKQRHLFHEKEEALILSQRNLDDIGHQFQKERTRCEQLSEEKEALSALVSSLQNQLQQHVDEEKKLQDTIQSLENQLTSLRDECQKLTHENETIQLQLEHGNLTSKQVDEYKKRAQGALKKANALSSQLELEISEKNKEIEEWKHKEQYWIAEMASSQALGQKTEDSLRMELLQERNASLEFKNRLETLEKEYQAFRASKEQELLLLKSSTSVNHSTSLHSSHAESFEDFSMKKFNNNQNVVSHEMNVDSWRDGNTLYDSSSPRVEHEKENKTEKKNEQENEKDNNIHLSSHSETMHEDVKEDSKPMKRSQSSSSASTLLLLAGNENLVYVNDLRNQRDELTLLLASRGAELERLMEELHQEKDSNKKLKKRVEELTTFLERSRRIEESMTMKNANNVGSGIEASSSLTADAAAAMSNASSAASVTALPTTNTAVNWEYLRKCVFRYVSTSKRSEKKRLVPVLAMLLAWNGEEVELVERSLQGSSDYALASAAEFSQNLSSWTSNMSFWGGSS